jgi:acyl carrier protein
VLMPLDARALRKQLQSTVPPLLRLLIRPPRRAAGSSARSWAQELRHLEPGQRLTAVEEAVRDAIASVLSLSSGDHVPTQRPLQDLGLDSMMAVEVRNRLSKRAGVNLSATLAFDYPTAAAISGHLVQKLGLAQAVTAPAAAAPEVISSLSDEEALERLQRELSDL